MPTLNSIIDDLVVGSDLWIRRPITGLPAGVTLSQAWLTIKENSTQTDAQAIIQKSITSAATSQGQITDTGADTAGELLFYLIPLDTEKLDPCLIYEFDVKVKLSDGRYSTPEKGQITPVARITEAT